MSASELSRRALVTTAVGAGAVASGIAKSHVLAQAEATPPPLATPEAVESTGDSEFEANVSGDEATVMGPPVPPEFTDQVTNWPVEGGNLKATRAAQGSTISTANVGELGVGWRAPVVASSTYGSLTSNPAIVGDIVYVQDATSNVYAWSLTSGQQVWKREYNLPVPSGGPNGVAVAYGNAYFPVGSDGLVVAVNATTGEDVWQVSIEGPLGEGITMSPLVYDSTVYISTIPGNDGAFYKGGQRGVIHAIDAATGNLLWYFDTTTDNLWNNPRANSGGGLWHPPSVDDIGNLYVGVGNAAPYPGNEEYPAGSSRTGENDYANCTIRINPATGGIDWYVNVKPFDLFDLDNQLTPILATVPVDGVDTPVAYSSGKHGIVVAFHAETGAELWRVPVGLHQNDNLGELPEEDYVEVLPGTLGGVETPMAFANGVLYVPVYNMSSFYNASGIDPASIDITRATGQLVAIDGATGAILWDVAQPTGLLAGATVANDLVFTGGLDGVVRAFNVADGSQVWTFQAGAGLNAPFAISGDVLIVPAGGPLIPSVDTFSPPPETGQEVIAITLGGEVQATPVAGPATPQAVASPVGDGTGFTVNAIDINFDPKELTIPANADVEVTVTNQGVLQHDFVIDALNVKTPMLNGDESFVVTINASAGTYEYYCSVRGHREAGMSGTLTVQ
jgi:glucose dehydrogenase/plastocyanin